MELAQLARRRMAGEGDLLAVRRPGRTADQAGGADNRPRVGAVEPNDTDPVLTGIRETAAVW